MPIGHICWPGIRLEKGKMFILVASKEHTEVIDHQSQEAGWYSPQNLGASEVSVGGGRTEEKKRTKYDSRSQDQDSADELKSDRASLRRGGTERAVIRGGAGRGDGRCTCFPNGDMSHMTYHIRRADVGFLGDLRSYNVNPLRGLLCNLGGPPLGVKKGMAM
jgi:hypothetical protein